jgi:hypothetical protein
MEALIKRAAAALGANVPVVDITAELVSSGVSHEDAFLAIQAAEILITPWGPRGRVTLPEIPASKRPPGR